MEQFKESLCEKIKKIELFSIQADELSKEIEKKFENYVIKARETLKKKHAINPKPHKRLMRVITEDEDDEEEEEKNEMLPPPAPAPRTNASRSKKISVVTEDVSRQSVENLRPVRTAKSNANKHLKELPQHTKMRNDNNIAVLVKMERISTVNKSSSNRESLKENAKPDEQQQRISVDEGVQMETESEIESRRNDNGRSMSVELIPTKSVEIDITDDTLEKMPPPPALPPQKRKTRQKQKTIQLEVVPPVESDESIPLRITRSKIKTEKSSLGKTVSASIIESEKPDDSKSVQKSMSESATVRNQSKASEATVNTKKSKKKYPLPMLIKLEPLSDDDQVRQVAAKKTASPKIKEKELDVPQTISPPPQRAESPPFKIPEIPMNGTVSSNNETVTISSSSSNNERINETVTISSGNNNAQMNETVTLVANNINETVTLDKNPNDSLMTEDNDDEETSAEVPLSQIVKSKAKALLPPQPLQLKLKKNEVFNPYLASPVKQKVQAFEKHAVHNNTPDKLKQSGAKYNTLKSGTPSKIALFSSKTTPMNNAKQRFLSTVSSSASSLATTSTTTSSSSSAKRSTVKKYTSLSHEVIDDSKKNPNQLLDEKRKQREEKMRQAQLQREAIEKQKREQTLQQQREREEKFRKIMQEKEEAKRLAEIKKKQYKENQEKKYAEEKARKDDFALPKEPTSASKDNSLHMKMQKQLMIDKVSHQKKKQAHDINSYSFDMLNTDDSTDDESRPTKKRPEPPAWCKKQHRSQLVTLQSYANASALDTLFSAKPINVDLREIFPAIAAHKLNRNSSAVWNTPPRYSQMPKY